MKKLALVSVSDKTGLLPFVKSLCACGLEILSTGGTAKYLSENNIPVTLISDYTGQKEILDGRVKTLHPKIHGGILARRSRKEDLQQLQEAGIAPIDFVIVNLYPFVQQISQAQKLDDDLVEYIDIGGPTMIRAAAKNSQFVVPVCDPADYEMIIREYEKSEEIPERLRAKLAAKVFTMMAAYDGEIARYFSLRAEASCGEGRSFEAPLAPVESITLCREEELRYGENPHQQASFYKKVVVGNTKKAPWRQLQGKQLSYNNLLDTEAALDLFLEFHPFQKQVAVIMKHTNPCGVALRQSATEAFLAARECDPQSAFGGIIAVSGELSGALAEIIVQGFVEVVISSQVSAEAVAVFERKKNIRVLECDLSGGLLSFRAQSPTIRRALDGYLLQTPDRQISEIRSATVVTKERPSLKMTEDLEFAWKICKHVKSNAIVIVKDGTAIGVGAGQMSRVDAARIALRRAKDNGHEVRGGVAASDAFLPFSDTLEILNDEGIVALVQPGGSLKDEEVIKEADLRKMSMVFTGERHFRH